MRPSLKALRSSASERAHRAAAGAAAPAGQDPLPPAELAPPGAVERGTLRRRLRRARRMRETLLTELGALVMEMHRQGRGDAALVERKAREALVADREALGLARALDDGDGVTKVVAAGIAGTCTFCGSLVGTEDRFCSRCGVALSAAARPVTAAYAAAPPPAAATQAGAMPPPAAGARVDEPPPAPNTQVGVPSPPPPGAAPSFDAPSREPGRRFGTPAPASRPPVGPGATPPPPPPDTGTRAPGPAGPAPPPPGRPAAPPPDPTTRVLPSTGDPDPPIDPRTPRT